MRDSIKHFPVSSTWLRYILEEIKPRDVAIVVSKIELYFIGVWSREVQTDGLNATQFSKIKIKGMRLGRYAKISFFQAMDLHNTRLWGRPRWIFTLGEG